MPVEGWLLLDEAGERLGLAPGTVSVIASAEGWERRRWVDDRGIHYNLVPEAAVEAQRLKRLKEHRGIPKPARRRHESLEERWARFCEGLAPEEADRLRSFRDMEAGRSMLSPEVCWRYFQARMGERYGAQ